MGRNSGRNERCLVEGWPTAPWPAQERPYFSRLLASAQKMVEAVRRRDVSAYLTFNRRMDSGVQLLRDAIGSGTIGQPVTVFGSYRQQWNASPSSRDWRFDPAQVGPSRVITEIGSQIGR